MSADGYCCLHHPEHQSDTAEYGVCGCDCHGPRRDGSTIAVCQIVESSEAGPRPDGVE